MAPRTLRGAVDTELGGVLQHTYCFDLQVKLQAAMLAFVASILAQANLGNACWGQPLAANGCKAWTQRRLCEAET